MASKSKAMCFGHLVRNVAMTLFGSCQRGLVCKSVPGAPQIFALGISDILYVKGMNILRAQYRSYETVRQEVKKRGVVGLYGYDVLKSAKGFRVFAQQAMEKSEEIIDRIKQLPPSLEVIGLFDDLSDTICTVVDSAELCRNTHHDMDYVNEASEASLKIYEFLHSLNTNPILYNALVKAERSGVLTTEEAKRAAETLRMDFERGGIHLSQEKLERVQDLNLQITRLGREFVGNILKNPGQVDIFPASKLPKCLRHLAKPVFKNKDGKVTSSLKAYGSTEDSIPGARMTTESGNLFSILKWATDSEVRRKAYMEGYSVPKNNLCVLDELIAARHEMAQLLGYRSFAEFTLAPTMARNPKVVSSFLDEMSMKIRGKADEELKRLEQFGKEIEGNNFKGVNAWDEAYYTGLMKACVFEFNATVVASYFPLAQCIQGLEVIIQSLFGASFKQVPLASGEVWNLDVQKFTLHHPSEGDLGHMYLDLYSREGKFPGCAHFAVRGGRCLSNNEYQLPVVALVCNFSSPGITSCPILNHWEVETLFHEFGHALHSLLSRTSYQHFSGTRTVLDFVEIPSHLFEYYAWDYRVLTKFAKHYATGDVIPKKLVESMCGAKNMFAATELQHQVLYAMMDQAFFGEQPLLAEDTTSVISNLNLLHTSWRHVEGTHLQTRFNHFVTYGAGYYSYLYARCFAASIWHRVCLADPLSSEAGDILRNGLLQYGGAKDPTVILRECLGEKALVSCSAGGIKPVLDDLTMELGI